MRSWLIVLVLCVASSAAFSQTTIPPSTVPAAIYTDPPADPFHPAISTVLHIPSHGVSINGLIYQPAGPGPHPTLIICHGLPGNEKNLDLAQAVRRAGWNAVTFNYRGSWGSPGSFGFAHSLEDADAVLAYLRDPANATALGIDPQRIAIAGHSMGGWVAALTAGHDHKLIIGVIMISGADMGFTGEQPRDAVVSEMAHNMDSLSGVTAEGMADELRTNAKAFRWDTVVPALTQTPLLVLTSNDGLASMDDNFAHAIRAQGGKNVTATHFATDHSWNDHRIALESTIITWLGRLH